MTTHDQVEAIVLQVLQAIADSDAGGHGTQTTINKIIEALQSRVHFMAVSLASGSPGGGLPVLQQLGGQPILLGANSLAGGSPVLTAPVLQIKSVTALVAASIVGAHPTSTTPTLTRV